jgi:transposase
VNVNKSASSEGRRPQDWSVEEKIQLVIEAAAVAESELGAFLRAKGLHEADLAEWRSAVMDGARATLADDEQRRQGKSRGGQAKQIKELTKQVQELQKELTRKRRPSPRPPLC